jgi:hypothetical protein
LAVVESCAFWWWIKSKTPFFTVFKRNIKKTSAFNDQKSTGLIFIIELTTLNPDDTKARKMVFP